MTTAPSCVWMSRPTSPAPVSVEPSIRMIGAAAKPSWVVPSIVRPPSPITGSGESRLIVCGPVPMAKLIVSAPLDAVGAA